MIKRLLTLSPWMACLGLLSLLMVDSAFAQQGSLVTGGYTGCGEDNLFSPPCSDKSIEYLSRIFGKVGGVLTGAEGTLLQEMFSVFNAAVLGLGSIVIMYTLFVGTIRTASEGEMLGQKWSSVWIPIKSALGIIMIVPANATGGYSFIQVFFMWVIVQGVGAADTLWSTILESLADEKPVIAQPMMMGSKLAFNETFQGLVCMYALNKIEDPDGAPSYAPVTQGNTTYFRAGPYGDACGRVTVDEGGDVTGNTPVQALQASIAILQEAAMSVVYEEESSWPKGALANAIGIYSGAMTAKIGKYKKDNGSESTMNEAMTRARDLGWIFAGSYYYDIARIQDRISLQAFNVPTATITYMSRLSDATQFAPPNPTEKFNIFSKNMRNAGKYITQNPVYGSARDFAKSSQAGAFSDPQGTGRTSLEGQLSDASGIEKNFSGIKTPQPEKLAEVPADSPVREVTDFMYNSLNDLLSFFQQHMSGEDPTTGQQINPMFAMQTFGTYILFTVELIWLTITVILALLALVATAAGAVSAATFGLVGGDKIVVPMLLGLLNFITWVISWLGPILLFMFAIGGVLSHYIPLIPFLFFTFGAIGWLLLCFEAIVAAPIVALGLLHPEGDLLGKADPAVFLITNVFLTPSLLLFGMIGAMMLSYVVVSMVNFGFYNAMTAFTGVNEGTTGGQIVIAVTSITTFVAFITIYMGTLMYAVEKCFSLIPELRTKILQWIGHRAEDFGEKAALGEVKGKHEGGAKAAGQKRGESFDRSTSEAHGKAKKQMGDKMSETKSSMGFSKKGSGGSGI